MKTTQAKKLALSKLMLQLNNLQRQNVAGTPASMFWGRILRDGGVPNLGRSEVDQLKLAKVRQQMREWDRTRQDKKFQGDSSSFDTGDQVRYWQDGQWDISGEIVQVRTHGSGRAQSYYIKNDQGNVVLRPRKHVRILSIYAMRVTRKLDKSAIRVRFRSNEEQLAATAAGPACSEQLHTDKETVYI